MNALHENTPWAAELALDAGSARRRRITNAAVWTASVLAHAAVLALIASRFGAKRIEPPVVPPIAIEVVAPARPAPAATPPAPQPPKPPPRPAPHPVAKAVPPKVRAPLAPAVQPTERASPKAPDVAPTHPAPPSAAPAPTPPAPAPEPVVTPPVGNAAYLRNPAPRYPEAAQEEGWEGRVVLRVHVDAAGRPVSVDLHASSGHEVLDKAALAAVRRWTFVPAKRGSTPIDGWVDVPLDFRLN
ncbi:energy transducer TonB [Trinickia sp.]|uniref:energy transducer TonB n=1 Tax=Trinickia sp. TaxID=2571163 RepID=UPI003F7ED0CA